MLGIVVATLSLLLASLAVTTAAPRHVFKVEGDHFTLDGRPFVIRSGEMHYPRIPRAYWPDRLAKAKAMGLNTICTYVFWNLHEPQPGKWDFGGNNDVAAFVKEAQKQGLFVLLRPGPYVCSEWDWGGFPYWLANVPGIQIRQNNPQFLGEATKYLKEAGKWLAPLTVEHGGPILMCQVENEYGSFGHDHEYMSAIRDAVKAAGFTCQLYTSDGPGQGLLNGGTLPDCLSVCNFGGGPAGAFEEFAKFRQGVPRMCGEFWAGWFDHWGDDHASTDPVSQAKDLDWFLSNGVSFNIYMVHGGTSFGWMPGANSGGPAGYEPDVTSYDYDSAISEDGSLTRKWRLFRDVIARHLAPSETIPDPPFRTTHVAIPAFGLREEGSLAYGNPVESASPLSFEQLGHPYGLVSYETKQPSAGTLKIGGLQDYATVVVDGKRIGTLDRRQKQDSIEVPAGSMLQILVESNGRINFSRALLNERKGFAAATVNGASLTGWTMRPVSMGNVSAIETRRALDPALPRWFSGHFVASLRGDTFVDMRGWGKGYVWVNGHNLGRFWHVGAQQSLYLPGVWVNEGENEVRVLELDPRSGPKTIQCVEEPVYQRAK